MGPSLSILPAGARRIAALVLLAVMPVVFMGAKARLAEARGPLWLGSNSDPSYAYLFNALQLAETGTVTHVDHPGTTAQGVGALVLLLPRVGWSTMSWIQSVLERPDYHLELIVALVNASTALLLFFGGLFLCQRLGDLGLALLAQAPSLIFSLSFGYTATWFAPELFFPAIGFALSCVYFVALRDPNLSIQAAWWAGVLSGLGLFNKMTFFPYLALGAFCFRRKALIIFCAGFAATLLPWLWIVRHQLGYLVAWVAKLALHSGRYGEGSMQVIDVQSYPRDLAGLLTSDPLYVPLLLLGLFIPLVWFFRGRPARQSEGREFLTLFGLTLLNLFSFLLVAKHAAAHYLVPVVSLAPLGLLLVCSCLQSLSGGRVRTVWFVLLLVPALAGAAPRFGGEVSRLEQRHVAEIDLRESALSYAWSVPDGPSRVVPFYRASSPAYALFFGNVFVDLRYANTLGRLHPQALFADFWAKAYADFAGPLSSDEVYRRNSGIILVGSEDLLQDGGGGSFPVPPGGRLREVLRTGAGGIYHVERD